MLDKKINGGIGIPSVLLIFVILCLMTFGILSVVTVSSDKKLSDLTAKKSADYYNALGKSQELSAVADSAVKKAAEGDKSESFEKRLKDNIKDTDLKMTSQNGVIYLEWSVNVNKAQVITTKAKADQNADKRLEIVSRNLASVGDWQGDDRRIDVYGS